MKIFALIFGFVLVSQAGLASDQSCEAKLISTGLLKVNSNNYELKIPVAHSTHDSFFFEVPYPARFYTATILKSQCKDLANCISNSTVLEKTSINNLTGEVKVGFKSQIAVVNQVEVLQIDLIRPAKSLHFNLNCQN